ncbi:MAG: hypothetical protein NW223_20725 [Hyphomicrobiaceae bacterium]|nr:hypothetical protein [Hyphomicrobiaceae bacterium]
MRLNFRPLRRIHLGLLLPLAALALGGCAESDVHQYLGHSDTVSLGAGNAQAANRAIQEVDHWPAEARKRRADQDGKRAAIAIKRYEANKSIEPRGLTKRDMNINIGTPNAGPAASQ